MGASSFRLSTSGGSDFYVANLDYNGAPLNGFRMGSTGTGDLFNDMAVDSFGNVYVSGLCAALPCSCGALNASVLNQHFIARSLTVRVLSWVIECTQDPCQVLAADADTSDTIATPHDSRPIFLWRLLDLRGRPRR